MNLARGFLLAIGFIGFFQFAPHASARAIDSGGSQPASRDALSRFAEDGVSNVGVKVDTHTRDEHRALRQTLQKERCL